MGDFIKRKIIDWEEFEARYLEYLRKDPEAIKKLDELISLAEESTITLLCVEESPDYCHRSLLAKECQRRNPALIVIIE